MSHNIPIDACMTIYTIIIVYTTIGSTACILSLFIACLDISSWLSCARPLMQASCMYECM